MGNPNLLTVIGGIAVTIAFCAFAEAVTRQVRSHDRCHQLSRSLGNNPNDESDSWTHGNHMAKCQYGTDEQTAREFETWLARGKNGGDYQYASRRVEQQHARFEREERARTLQNERRMARQNEADRRALAHAQAQPQYVRYGVPTLDFCRDLAAVRAERASDEADRYSQFIGDCLAGRIPR